MVASRRRCIRTARGPESWPSCFAHGRLLAWPRGKARAFGSRIRRFESSRPNHDRARPAMRYDLKLFSGNANRPLAEEIAQYLSLPVSDAEISRFSDGEVFVQVNENVRGTDV